MKILFSDTERKWLGYLETLGTIVVVTFFVAVWLTWISMVVYSVWIHS